MKRCLNRFLNDLNLNQSLADPAQDPDSKKLLSLRGSFKHTRRSPRLNHYFRLGIRPWSLRRPAGRPVERSTIHDPLSRTRDAVPASLADLHRDKLAAIAAAVLVALYLFGAYEVNL